MHLAHLAIDPGLAALTVQWCTQTRSMRASTAASSTPSASASQVRTRSACGLEPGISLPTGESVSRY